MNIVHRLVNNFRTCTEKLVYDLCYKLFVARDRICTYYNEIIRSYRNVSVLVHSHSRERRHRLALTSRRDKNYLFRRETVHSVKVDDKSVGNFQVSKLDSSRNNVEHTSAEYSDLSVVCNSAVDDLLNAVDIRGECRNDYALAFCTVEKLHKGVSDCSLRSRVTGTLSVGRIRHKRKNSPASEFAETCKVDDAALDRREVDLEVARVDNNACRSVDGKSDRIGDRVVNADKFDRHAAHFYRLTWLYNVELRTFEKTVFFELALDKSDSKPCSVNGNVHLFEKISERADVVFVSVSDDNAPYLVGVLLDICEIGDNKVNAGHIAVGKCHSAVNDESIVCTLKNSYILADLVDSAEWDYSDRCALNAAVICSENACHIGSLQSLADVLGSAVSLVVLILG